MAKIPRGVLLLGGISLVKLHRIFGAFSAATDNIESSFESKSRRIKGLRFFVQDFWTAAETHGRLSFFGIYVHIPAIRLSKSTIETQKNSPSLNDFRVGSRIWIYMVKKGKSGDK